LGRNPKESLRRKAELVRKAREEFESTDFENGNSAAGGEMNTEGVDTMLREVGIEPQQTQENQETQEIQEDYNHMERVNEMLYGISNDGRAERFDTIIDEEPSRGIKNRHRELGLAEYGGGFQFLTEDGRTVRKAARRLMNETDLEIGEVAASLTMESGAKNPDAKLEMYQEIQANDYDTQKEIGEELGLDQADVSRYLSEWEDQDLVNKDHLELTEDGYEVAQTLRGLEAYAESK